MLTYDEVKERKYIIHEGEPYEVLSSHVFRKQQRKPVNAVKIRNLITGKITETSFHVSDKIPEADISTREIKYLYTNKGEYWFSEVNDPSKRFKLPQELLGSKIKFLKANSTVSAVIFDDPSGSSGQGKIIGLKMPVKVDLKVIEAFPAVKGDTAKGGSKQVKLETGAFMNVPMFIKEGDVIRINTEAEEYTDRIS